MTKKKEKPIKTQVTENSEDDTSTNMTSAGSKTALGAIASGPQIPGAPTPGGAVAAPSMATVPSEFGDTTQTATSPYPKKKSKKKKKEKKRHAVDLGDGNIVYANNCWGMFLLMIVRFQRIVNFVLALLWLINGCCFLAIGHEVLRAKLEPNITWNLSQEPDFAEFDRFSVSSSSEMCNELARMALMEEHLPLDAMPLLMLGCLYVAEPHASGPGGDTMIIYGDKRECDQINGIGLLPGEIKEILYKRLKDDPFAHFQGPSSIRYPGEMVAMVGVVTKLFDQILDPSEKKEIQEKFYTAAIVFTKELFEENLHFAVSYRLSEAIRRAPTAMLAITAGNHFLFDQEFRIRSEGELYPIPRETLEKYNPLFFDNIETSTLERRLPYDYEALLDKSMFFQRNEETEMRKKLFTKKRGNVFRYSKHSNGFSKKMDNGMTVCAPTPLRFMIEEPVVANMLPKYKKSEEKVKHADENHPLNVINVYFYTKILELFHGLRQRFSEYEKKRRDEEKKLQEKMKIAYEDNLEEEQEHRNRLYAAGNSFVLVDHKKRKGMALTATLGFGSLMSDGGDVIMNNLNMDMLRHGNKSGPFDFVHEAIIVMDGAQPHTVYAGLPGLPFQSLDVPRKLTALLLSVFHGVPLEMALTVPLLWTDGEEILLKGDFPYDAKDGLNKIMREEMNKTLPLRTHSQFVMDEATAVHERKAISMAMERGGLGRVMPNGL